MDDILNLIANMRLGLPGANQTPNVFRGDGSDIIAFPWQNPLSKKNPYPPGTIEYYMFELSKSPVFQGKGMG